VPAVLIFHAAVHRARFLLRSVVNMVRFVRGDSAANAGFRQKFFDRIYRIIRIKNGSRLRQFIFMEQKLKLPFGLNFNSVKFC
jgi:hypothetical protein